MKIKAPLGDKIVVETVPKKHTTVGGILLVGTATDTNTTQGRVLSIGEGTRSDKDGKLTPLDVKPGDLVLFHATSGIQLSEPRETPIIHLLREEDILAIVD